ncbi:histidinol-phosphatase HisJ family protein [Halorientalis pallida]|uniref:histidinol-phosphatase n=1 Tax=Halorientalis pallida TaxID=2479928 RepID=A0A498KRL6_9EURY|nr:histidinol-phosphatase HisJ family protein [Halorientalis pallida]RXK46333.1 histidinol-phosphatase HisJ family protein [Halorientalis pallida]
MDRDYHVHSTYSDGRFLFQMVRAATEAGLAGVGIADHCNVSNREEIKEQKHQLGFNLDETYERRREAIQRLREESEVEIYDGVEMDYHPEEEDAIRAFLGEAEFQYTIGSVHYLDGVNVHVEPYYAEQSESDRRAAVDRYFDHLVALIESELFDVAAHVDLVERNPALRGLATERHYRRVAEAFADSPTIPELNAGRALAEYGEFHPSPAFLDVLAEYDIPITVGSDAHQPEEIGERHPHIDRYLEARGIEPATLSL